MRKDIERAMLSTFLYRDLMSDRDFDIIIDYTIPYKLFTANRTHKLIAKSIFNLQEQDMPFTELCVVDYVSKIEKINEAEWLEVMTTTPITLNTMFGYVKILERMEQEDYIRRMR